MKKVILSSTAVLLIFALGYLVYYSVTKPNLELNQDIIALGFESSVDRNQLTYDISLTDGYAGCFITGDILHCSRQVGESHDKQLFYDTKIGSKNIDISYDVDQEYVLNCQVTINDDEFIFEDTDECELIKDIINSEEIIYNTNEEIIKLYAKLVKIF